MKRFSSIFILLLSFTFTFSQTTELTKSKAVQYNDFISKMKSNGISTGNILIYENGEIVFQNSNGIRSINPIDSLDLNSQFPLKSFN